MKDFGDFGGGLDISVLSLGLFALSFRFLWDFAYYVEGRLEMWFGSLRGNLWERRFKYVYFYAISLVEFLVVSTF